MLDGRFDPEMARMFRAAQTGDLQTGDLGPFSGVTWALHALRAGLCRLGWAA